MNPSELLELGLFLYRVYNDTPNTLYYKADDVHKLLGAGVEMKGRKANAVNGLEYTQFLDIHEKQMHWKPTLQSLVIGIKPLKAESEERKLLREFVAHLEKWNSAFVGSEYYTRARALLEGGG